MSEQTAREVTTLEIDKEGLLELLRGNLRERMLADGQLAQVVISTYRSIFKYDVDGSLAVETANEQVRLALCCAERNMQVSAVSSMIDLAGFFGASSTQELLDAAARSRTAATDKASSAHQALQGKLAQASDTRLLAIIYVGLEAMSQVIQDIRQLRSASPEIIIVAFCCNCGEQTKRVNLRGVVDVLTIDSECGGSVTLSEIATLVATEW